MSRRIILLLPLFLLFTACKDSDSWLAKAYRNTKAHYNTFFNAEQKWLETMQTVQSTHVDDYRSYIQLYNYGLVDNLKANQAAMDEVIKGTSTIIDKYPKSKWVDDAYLLNGKAYFLKGDINAAIELFEYCIKHYKDPIIVAHAKLWLYRCLLINGKKDEAESYITGIFNEKKFPEKMMPELYKAMGAIHLLQGKPKLAAEYLEKSLKGIKGKSEKYRMRFALGQAYMRMAKYDQANTHFAKVVKMNPPYDMAFQARIMMVEILSNQQGNHDKSLKILARMLTDDKNADDLGKIYMKMGDISLKAKAPKNAISYYQKAIMASNADNSTKTNAYLALGDYFNSKRNFEKAGLYYDSATKTLDEKHPEFKDISRKSLLLSELLRHLITIKQEDSLLRMANDASFREKCINNAIEAEKKAAADLEKRNKPGAPGTSNPGMAGNKPGGGTFVSGAGSNSSFPFYNQQLREQGRKEFEAQWGKRANQDYWRISSKKSLGGSAGGKTNENPSDTGSKKPMDGVKEVAPDKKKYYEKIPFEKEQQAEALKKIEEATFAAAGIYQNSLNEPSQAIQYYETLLEKFPKTKYTPQTYYELYRLYMAKKDQANADKYLALLKGNFPNSAFLKIIENGDTGSSPTTNISTEKKEIEEQYNKIYQAYQSGDCKTAIALKLEADKKYAGNKLQNKMDYMHAVCLVKSGDTAKGLPILRQISVDYPGTAIAEQASSTIQAYYDLHNGAGPSNAGKDTAKSDLTLWKKWDGKEQLMYLIVYPRGTNSNLLRATLNDFGKANFITENLDVSTARNVGETVYISVSGFSNPKAAMDFKDLLAKKADMLAAKGIFEFEQSVISLTNYKTLANNNRINSYMDFYKSM